MCFMSHGICTYTLDCDHLGRQRAYQQALSCALLPTETGSFVLQAVDGSDASLIQAYGAAIHLLSGVCSDGQRLVWTAEVADVAGLDLRIDSRVGPNLLAPLGSVRGHVV